MCEWDSASLTSAHVHLAKQHSIEIQAGEIKAKKLRQERLSNIFNKIENQKQARLERHEEKILRSAINHEAVNETLTQLITLRNLPYNTATWPELQALLTTVNYTVEDVLVITIRTILKLIEISFVVYREILKLKLHRSLSKIHFLINI